MLDGSAGKARAPGEQSDFEGLRREARRIARAAVVRETPSRRLTAAVDRVALHPVAGLVLLLALLFIMFQAVYAWSEAPIAMIEGFVASAGDAVTAALPDGLLRSFLVDGVLNGVGSVIVFRSEERRVGQECVSTCRSLWSPYNINNNKQQPSSNLQYDVVYISTRTTTHTES